MKNVVLPMLFAGLLAAGCGGGHNSPTEPGPAPSAAPVISNLKALSFDRVDASSGDLPISFDFSDPQGDVSEVLVTTVEGTATNPAEDISGQRSGTYSFLQAVHLPNPDSPKLAFSVQVKDAAGNLSNVLSGEVALSSH